MKHHLRFMPSTSPTLYMPIVVGGMGLFCLSTHITLDKFAELHRGLLSDFHTVRAITGLLDRSLRIGHSESDAGYEATMAVRNEIYHSVCLNMLMKQVILFAEEGFLLLTLPLPACHLDCSLPSKNCPE